MVSQKLKAERLARQEAVYKASKEAALAARIEKYFDCKLHKLEAPWTVHYFVTRGDDVVACCLTLYHPVSFKKGTKIAVPTLSFNQGTHLATHLGSPGLPGLLKFIIFVRGQDTDRYYVYDQEHAQQIKTRRFIPENPDDKWTRGFVTLIPVELFKSLKDG